MSVAVVGALGKDQLMSEKKLLFDEPSKVAANEGIVDVDGPDAVDVALTPEAAEQTASRLEDEAVKARGQRRLRDFPHKPTP